MSTVTLLEAALEYAAKGWAVFPCHSLGSRAKSPLTEHGHLDASQNPDVISAWWQRWPDAMVGAPVPDSLIVLDIDPRNGGSIEALEVVAGPVPETLTTWSGRGDGGRHLYFLRLPGELTGTKLPAGIDLKANGYTILPPSVHPASGKPYTWEIHEVARLTPVLRELLRPTPPRQQVSGTKHSDGTPLVRLVAGLTEGQRNRGLFWAACRAADDGILSDIENDLVNAAVGTGLCERMARRTIASARRTTGASL